MGQELCLAFFHKMVEQNQNELFGQPNRRLSSSWPPLEYKEIQYCEISQMRLIVYKHSFWLTHFQDQGWQQWREQEIHAKVQTEDPHKVCIYELQDVSCLWRRLRLEESSHAPHPPSTPTPFKKPTSGKTGASRGSYQHSCWSWTCENSTVLVTSFTQQSEPEGGGPRVPGLRRKS